MWKMEIKVLITNIRNNIDYISSYNHIYSAREMSRLAAEKRIQGVFLMMLSGKTKDPYMHCLQVTFDNCFLVQQFLESLWYGDWHIVQTPHDHVCHQQSSVEN